MAVTPGPVKRVERPMASWPFRLPMQTQELQLARMELLSGQPTEATPGSVKQVGRRIMSLLFHSPMRITEQLLAGTG